MGLTVLVPHAIPAREARVALSMTTPGVPWRQHGLFTTGLLFVSAGVIEPGGCAVKLVSIRAH
jgi:hypothetical protein